MARADSELRPSFWPRCRWPPISEPVSRWDMVSPRACWRWLWLVSWGCEREQIRHVQQVSLVRFLGCNADAGGTARMAGGNEFTLMAALSLAHMGSSGETLQGPPPNGGRRPKPRNACRLVASALTDTDADARSLSEHCEVGAILARRLGLDQEVIMALQHSYERWDGGGHPGWSER